MQSLKSTAVAAAILAAILASPLYAQNEGPTLPSAARDCPPDVAPPRSRETTGRAPLSEALSESKGVDGEVQQTMQKNNGNFAATVMLPSRRSSP